MMYIARALEWLCRDIKQCSTGIEAFVAKSHRIAAQWTKETVKASCNPQCLGTSVLYVY
jgi:hypothetical protein